MPRADDAEVAAVERCHFSGVEPLRCRDYRGVNGAERQVSVLGNEPRNADGVAGVQRHKRSAPMPSSGSYAEVVPDCSHRTATAATTPERANPVR
jgi:hypothetical protein